MQNTDEDLNIGVDDQPHDLLYDGDQFWYSSSIFRNSYDQNRRQYGFVIYRVFLALLRGLHVT